MYATRFIAKFADSKMQKQHRATVTQQQDLVVNVNLEEKMQGLMNFTRYLYFKKHTPEP
jgi:hypothetical protein